MEDKFKKINEISKAWENQEIELTHSFAGDLFKDSGWYFAMDEELMVVATQAPVVEAKSNLESVTPKAYEAVKKEGIQVIFIGDSYQDNKGEDLLGKMIGAMKLSANEFIRIKLNDELENIEDLALNVKSPTQETLHVFNEIQKHRPVVVVSLGAIVTNVLLGKREKLSTIHGQFFNLSTSSTYNYQLMPIFHPDYLLINPNMKRTAWIDLQKVMKTIGKI